MKKYAFIFLLLGFFVYLTGCGKKQPSLEEMQEPLSMEAMSVLNATPQTAPEPKAAALELPPLPPSGPYKPAAAEIQTALSNAGYYTGAVDGKIGPLSKRAIEEFQKANGLQADGKVGPKTWALLSNHLNPPAQTKSGKR